MQKCMQKVSFHFIIIFFLRQKRDDNQKITAIF